MKTLNYYLLALALAGCKIDSMAQQGNPNERNFGMEDTSYWKGLYTQELHLISKDGYFGLADNSGNLRTPVQYDRIFLPHENAAIVSLNNSYGVIDLEGKEIVPSSFKFLSEFSNGMAWYSSAESHAAGFLTTDGRQIAAPPKTVIRKINGQHLYTSTSGHSLLDSKGNEIYKILFASFDGATGDNLFAQDSDPWLRYDQGVDYQQHQREARENGELQEPVKLPANLPFIFYENKAVIPVNVNGTIKTGYIDPTGSIILPAIYDDAQRFVNGYACVKQAGKWGVIDINGAWAIRPSYSDLENMNGYYFLFTEQNKKGVVTLEEKVVVPSSYLRAHYLFGDVFAFLPDTEHNRLWLQQHSGEEPAPEITSWGAVNVKTGETLLPFEFQWVQAVGNGFGIGINYTFSAEPSRFSEEELQRQSYMSQAPATEFTGVATSTVFDAATIKGTFSSVAIRFWSLYLNTGEMKQIIVARHVGDYYAFNDRFVDVRGVEVRDAALIAQLRAQSNRKGLETVVDANTGKFGVKTNDNRWIVPAEYDVVELFNSGIIVAKEGLYSFFDLTGKQLLPFIYTRIEELPSGILQVNTNETEPTTILIDKHGNQLK